MLVACVFKAVTADRGPLARTVDKGWIIWWFGHNYTIIQRSVLPVLCQQTKTEIHFVLECLVCDQLRGKCRTGIITERDLRKTLLASLTVSIRRQLCEIPVAPIQSGIIQDRCGYLSAASFGRPKSQLVYSNIFTKHPWGVCFKQIYSFIILWAYSATLFSGSLLYRILLVST